MIAIKKVALLATLVTLTAGLVACSKEDTQQVKQTTGQAATQAKETVNSAA